MRPILRFITVVAVCILSNVVHAQVTKVESIGITVSDLDQSVKFYTEVLGFKKISEYEMIGEEYERLQGLFGIRVRIAKLQLGDEVLELSDYLTSGGRGIPEDFKSNDLAFQHIAIVVSDMDKAYGHLRKFNVTHISTGPQTLPRSIPAAAGIKAFYFTDPDHHRLELIYFPHGKGQAKWQTNNRDLFLGIDHTAIGISNTDSSLNFYQGDLGFQRAGDSWNKGNEQSHLNFIENASLHITGLKTSIGPGVEFLEYIVPGPGRPYPKDSKADDLWHWQTTLIVSNIEDLYNRLNSRYPIISKGLVQIKAGDNHFKAFIVRDRDGHAMLIKEYLNKN